MMKRQMSEMTGFTEAAGGWLSAIAGLPAALVDAPARQNAQEWLGWDAWVTVSMGDPRG